MKVNLSKWQIRSACRWAKKTLLLIASVMFISTALIAQQGETKTGVLTGIVMDQSGETLPGASVLVKGTTTGVMADENGKYSLNVPYGATVQFSYMGYKTVEIVYKGQETQNVKLESEATNIKDVVVTGIANRKAESYTGAYTQISGEELRSVGHQNLISSIANLDASMYVFTNFEQGANPNALPDMQMRGGTSFGNSEVDVNLRGNFQSTPNQPMFMLNGFKVSLEKVLDLDMNIVESYTLLKDAAAKAIYGADAANGVVLIETKKLSSDKPRITYTGSVDLQMPDLSSYDLCHSVEKLDVELLENYYLDSSYDLSTSGSNAMYAKRWLALNGNDTYWLSKPVRFGYGQKHNLNVELGNGDLRAGANLSYNNVVGIMKGSDRSTISGDMTLQYQYKGLNIKNYVSFDSNNSADTPYGSFSEYAVLNPYDQCFDEHGNVVKQLTNYKNPYYNGTINTTLTSGYTQFMDQFDMNYRLNDMFLVRAQYAITSKRTHGEYYYPKEHTSQSGESAETMGSFKENNGQQTVQEAKVTLNFSHAFGTEGEHMVFANLVGELKEDKWQEVYHTARGLLSDNLQSILSATGYGEKSRPGGSDDVTRTTGFTLTGSYSYNDRYFADLTLRTNGSSRFGKDKKWASFWSLGIGWNLHNEAFMENVDWLKQFKVIASIGTTGNQNLQANQSLAMYEYIKNTSYFGGFIGSKITNMENPTLQWEQKLEKNIGLQGKVWKFDFKFDYYDNNTQNVVTQITLHPSSGFQTYYENIGEVNNKGYEGEVALTAFNNKKGFLRFDFRFAHNENKIEKISDAMKKYNENIIASYTSRDKVSGIQAAQQNAAVMPALRYADGVDRQAIWAVRSAGIDPATGIEALYKKNGMLTYIYSGDDLVPCGTEAPDLSGNFGMSAEYKGIGLIVRFKYQFGGQYYNKTLLNKIENIQITQNFDRRVLTERWYYAGQQAYFKRLSGKTPYDMRNGIYWYDRNSGWSQEITRATSRFVQDRNDLELSAITLYYDFNRSLIKRWGMERLRVQANMNDVAVFSTIGVERGTDYPFSRTLSLQLSATF